MMKTTVMTAISVLIATMAFAQTPAAAEVKSRTQGVFLGGALEGAGVASDGTDTESGAGIGLTFGYGFTKNLAFYTNWSAASIVSADGLDNYGLGHFDVGVRAHFLQPTTRVRPFVQVAYGGRAINQPLTNHTLTGSNTGASFGGGLNIHIKPALAITTGMTWSTGSLKDWQLDDRAMNVEPLSTVTARFAVGVVWFPQSK